MANYIFIVSSFLIGVLQLQEPEIKLDGKIDEAEWLKATKHPLNSGVIMYELQTADALYIGIHGNIQGMAHVYLHANDTVNVLHASAALGSQQYVRQSVEWKIQNKFNWELRDSVYNDLLADKMKKYYRQHGWCANNSNTGDKLTLEFKIDLKKFRNENLSFAALFTSDARTLFSFPQQLKDDTQLPELVRGNNPDNLEFSPSSWATIKK